MGIRTNDRQNHVSDFKGGKYLGFQLQCFDFDE